MLKFSNILPKLSTEKFNAAHLEMHQGKDLND
jgi:hypothetical protein